MGRRRQQTTLQGSSFIITNTRRRSHCFDATITALYTSMIWTDTFQDLHDLFCILMVAVPLKMHRARLQKRYSSFTTYDALHKLSNLKFVHTNKRHSPDDPSIILLTTLVTTYAMVPEMARLLCQNFLDSRLMESCEGKSDFLTADSVWQPTPKGINLLQAFASRNGVAERHVHEVLESPRNNMRLLILERERDSDLVMVDRGIMEVIFRRFVGIDGPNVKNTHTGSDSDSINDSLNGVHGVKLIREKRIGGRIFQNLFTGRSCIDWLMTCCTFITEREACMVASRFLSLGFCELVSEDKPSSVKNLSPSKNALYRVTKTGMQAAQWIPKTQETSNGESPRSSGTIRDSNRSRMMIILTSPALRLLFREFLRDTHCEENFIFFTEVDDFLATWKTSASQLDGDPSMETMRETLAGSYGRLHLSTDLNGGLLILRLLDLYNAFLAPGSPCELNIDHNLRFALIKRMTKPELPEDGLRNAVDETAHLYQDAKHSIFKLMASVSLMSRRLSDDSLTQERIPFQSFCVTPDIPTISLSTAFTKRMARRTAKALSNEILHLN